MPLAPITPESGQIPAPITDPETIEAAKAEAHELMRHSFSLLTNPAHAIGNVEANFNGAIRIYKTYGLEKFQYALAKLHLQIEQGGPETSRRIVAAVGLDEFARKLHIPLDTPQIGKFRESLRRQQAKQEYRRQHVHDIRVDLSKLVTVLHPLRHEQELSVLKIANGEELEKKRSRSPIKLSRSFRALIPTQASIEPLPDDDILYSTLIGDIKLRLAKVYIYGLYEPVKFFDESVDLAIEEREQIAGTELPPAVLQRLERFRAYVKHEYLGVQPPASVRQAMQKAIAEEIMPAKSGRPLGKDPLGRDIRVDPRLAGQLAMNLQTLAGQFEERHDIKRYFSESAPYAATNKNPALRMLANRTLHGFFDNLKLPTPPLNYTVPHHGQGR